MNIYLLLSEIQLKEPLLNAVKQKNKIKESYIRPKRMAYEGLTIFSLNIFYPIWCLPCSKSTTYKIQGSKGGEGSKGG